MPISSSAARLDLVVEVARRHLSRALGQHLDRLGDAAGQVEAEPRGREDDDQGHQEEEQDVDALDRVLQQLELLVLLEGLADAAQPLPRAARSRGCPPPSPPTDVTLAVAHRHHRLRSVAVVQLVDGGDLLARRARASRWLSLSSRVGRSARTGSLTWTSSWPPALNTVIRADPQQVLLLDQERGQRLAALLGQQAVAVDHPAMCGRGGGRCARGCRSTSARPPVPDRAGAPPAA